MSNEKLGAEQGEPGADTGTTPPEGLALERAANWFEERGGKWDAEFIATQLRALAATQRAPVEQGRDENEAARTCEKCGKTERGWKYNRCPDCGELAPNCAHKQLKKQMVGEQLWYVCECGQKFRIEAWDGKVSVLAPPDPRKDLALEELAADWRKRGDKLQASISGDAYHEGALLIDCADELEQRLAEMRGAKR